MPARLAAFAATLALFVARAHGAPPSLDATDVERIIGQAVAEATAVGLPVAIVVVDHEGNILGTFTMPGARPTTHIDGLAQLGPVDPPSILAAVSKAGTAAFFSTQGNAFSTRTASFIIQPHFPPGVRNTSSGPLFGVQFSQLTCGDVVPRPGETYPPPLPPLPAGTLPLGLSADPGGVPLYKQGRAVGGVGVEGNGSYTADFDPTNGDVPKEERIAVAATRGFETPTEIRGDRILVNGLRLPFINLDEVPAVQPAAVPFGASDVAPRPAPASRFVPESLGGVRGTIDPRYFPPIDGIDPAPADGGLTTAEVLRILTQGARQANRTRAGIRRPLGDRARVNLTVVDRAGNVLGIFQTRDAAIFGFDVSAQKARTAAFFSRDDTRAQLLVVPAAEPFASAAVQEGIPLDGRTAFSDRAIGFVSRPFFPDGIDGTRHGPFSRQLPTFSIFNDGLQVDLLQNAFAQLLTGTVVPCTGIPGLGNGIQIFPGSVPLYRGDRLIGAIGISGDGVDQDDIVSFAGARGFQAPPRLRADRVRVRDVRLPYVKFPRRPTTR